MDAVAEALALLEVDRLMLSVPDSAYPWSDSEDLGRGSPYAASSQEFLRFVRSLGFTGVQAMPPGRISPINPSPYDGSFFARNELFIRASRVGEDSAVGPLVTKEDLQVPGNGLDPNRTDHARTWHRHKQWLTKLHAKVDAALTAEKAPELQRELQAFREAHPWLSFDREYEFAHDPSAAEGFGVDRFTLEQFLVHRHHQALREELRSLGLQWWGDLQVGPGPMDRARLQDHWLPGYRLGAPPSRTNPEGQPWGFPVLNPDHMGPDGPARSHFETRLRKLLSEYDGLRIDHPHGLVCPWVYRDGPDPAEAVQTGARLFESPHLPDHPDLARYARVSRAQLASASRPRYADDWVRDLTHSQVQEYGELMQFVVHACGGPQRVACEVLSTEPTPLRRVRRHLGLGRFLVTQKAVPTDADDIYQVARSESEDWVMIGNHDTPTIWGRLQEWSEGPRREREASVLARKLGGSREILLANDERLARAKLSDLFLGPARNVLVFFGDLWGLTEPHNRPGIVEDHNWSQRVPSDFRKVRLDLGGALADALDALDRGTPDLKASLRQLIRTEN